jgi:hypothetical protein
MRMVVVMVNNYHLKNGCWRVVGGGGDGRFHNNRKRASGCSFSVVVKW